MIQYYARIITMNRVNLLVIIIIWLICKNFSIWGGGRANTSPLSGLDMIFFQVTKKS